MNKARGQVGLSQGAVPEHRVDVLMVTTVAMSLGFLDGLVTSLAQRGLRVGVVCSPDLQLIEFACKHRVPAWAVPMSRTITPLRDLVALVRLLRVIRAARPTIVHAQTPKGGLLGTLAAALSGVPARIYHVRGLPAATATGVKRRLLLWTERCACALAHHVLCVSPSLRAAILALRLCRSDRISVPANGSGQGVDSVRMFNPAKFPPDTRLQLKGRVGIPSNAPVVGFVGRIVRDKGVVELREAWRAVKKAVPGAHLIIIGPEEPQDPVPADVIQSLQSDPTVHMVGRQVSSVPFYSIMDVCVLPSHREGFPNVALEAASMELPMVVSDCVGCIDAVVHGVTGTIVPVGDSDALAHALITYLQDPQLRRKHGRAGRERVMREYDPATIFRAIQDVYARLVMSKGAKLSPGALRADVSRD